MDYIHLNEFAVFWLPWCFTEKKHVLGQIFRATVSLAVI